MSIKQQQQQQQHHHQKQRRIVVFISGVGSNLQALIDAERENQFENAKIVGVVSNRIKAHGSIRAKDADIPTLYLSLKAYKDHGKTREDFDHDLAMKVREEFSPDLIVLAGWMHIVTADFLTFFPDRVINLHPALPGAFDGVNAIERAYEAYGRGDITHSGIMVHAVTPVVDHGRIILTEEVPMVVGESIDAFTERMHSVEHRLIVEGVQKELSNSRE